MKKNRLFLSFLLMGLFFSASDWPVYMGNVYFTGNNDQLIVQTNTVQWTFIAYTTWFNPIVSDGRVYVSDLNKQIVCLDLVTGRELWNLDLVTLSRQMGRPSAQAGKIKYPVIRENWLYLSDATALYCINKTNGHVLWARAGLGDGSQVSALDDSIYADPVTLDYRVIYGTRKYFMARNYTNGQVLWVNREVTSFGGFPSYYKGRIYTQSKDMKNSRFVVFCLDASSGRTLWQTSLANTLQIFNPVIYHDRIYVPSGKLLYCLDPDTGSILWQKEYSDLVTSGPAFTDRSILFSIGNREVVAVNPENGDIRQRFVCGEASSPRFVIIGDQLYLAHIRDQGTYLAAYRLDNPAHSLWSWQSPGPGAPSLMSAADGMLLLSVGNTLYNLGQPRNVTPLPLYTPDSIITWWPDQGPTNILVRTNVIELNTLRKGDSLILPSIHFEINEAYLKHESLQILDQLVLALKKYPRIKLEIQGHTDSTGDRESNQTLSEKRAEVVRDYLVKQGVGPERLLTVGYGQDRPLASNNTEDGRTLNRRTQFVIFMK